MAPVETDKDVVTAADEGVAGLTELDTDEGVTPAECGLEAVDKIRVSDDVMATDSHHCQEHLMEQTHVMMHEMVWKQLR